MSHSLPLWGNRCKPLPGGHEKAGCRANPAGQAAPVLHLPRGRPCLYGLHRPPIPKRGGRGFLAPDTGVLCPAPEGSSSTPVIIEACPHPNPLPLGEGASPL